MNFENLFLINAYARDKPIESLSEFSYYLSLLTNPKSFILHGVLIKRSLRANPHGSLREPTAKLWEGIYA